MARRSVKERVGWKDATTMLCRGCDKRLAEVRPLEPDSGSYYELGVDWILYGATHSESMVQGIKDLGHEDWYSLRCGRCGHDHQGREATLWAIAKRHPGGRVTMPARSTGVPVRSAEGADLAREIKREVDPGQGYRW